MPHCAVRMIDASSTDVAALVRDETDGHGADIVYNTVGSPYFAAANQAMAHGGRQILIATVERPVPFDIFTFYRGRHSFFGIDSLALDASASAALLRELVAGFANGQLQPFPVVATAPAIRWNVRKTPIGPSIRSRRIAWCCCPDRNDQPDAYADMQIWELICAACFRSVF